MSTVVGPHKQAPTPGEDPFRYGWRYVRRTGPDGKEEWDQVPLTPEDVLHPQEEDFIVQTDAHDNDRIYLKNVLRARLENRPDALVLADHRVDWGVPGVRPHGPDIAVFFGVQQWDPRQAPFYVAKSGGRPILVIEITSPTTRDNALGIKVTHYHRVGIPWYVIVDREPEGHAVQLIGYQHTPRRYAKMPCDDQGRLWLEPLGLWLGAKGDRVVCYDGETEEELGDYVTLSQALEAERTRAEAAKARAEAAEARHRELEAELRRLRGENQAEQA